MKRLSSLAALFTMLCLICPTLFGAISVRAVDNTSLTDVNHDLIDDSEQVRDIITQIGHIRLQEMTNSKNDEVGLNSSRLSDNSSAILVMEEQLKELGVSKLTDSEVMQQFSGPSSPYAYLPPSTSSVEWYMHGSYYTFEGTMYYVKQLYAQPKSFSSNLADYDDGVVLQTDGERALEGMTKLLSFGLELFVDNALSNIKTLSWIPIDFGIDQNITLSETKYTVSYQYLVTVCFCYVNLASEDENVDELTYTSTVVDLQGTSEVFAISDGQNIHGSNDYAEIIYSSNYASKESACRAFVYISAPQSAFVKSWYFYGPDGKRSAEIGFPTPMAWSLIY